VSETALDMDRVEAFGEQVLGSMNGAGTALFLSIGHRTGLFDTMSGMAPSTSEQIASVANLNERYVREWLNGLVVAGVLEYDAEGRTYALPAEHAALLTRAAGPDNFAFFAQYLALLGEVEGDVIDAFRNGGGVPYERYPRFQGLQREETARLFDVGLVDTILPLAPEVVERLRAGTEAADVGTGGGHAVNVMGRAFPGSRFTGFDISEQGLAMGRREAEDWGLDNVSFVQRDAGEIDGSFGLITTFDVIHDLAQPAAALDAIARSLAPDGIYLMGEIAASSKVEENIDNPIGPMLYMFSVFYCMTTALSQDGVGVGTAWGDQLCRQYLADAGFTAVDARTVEGDIFNVYYVCQKT
jgi:ubiquinone/menaquinone biosynthesis C-methylase UbiE